MADPQAHIMLDQDPARRSVLLPRLGVTVLSALVALAACSDSLKARDQPQNLQVAADAWEPLDPGDPPAPDAKFDPRLSRVLHAGTGWKIAPGDLVQVRLRTPKATRGFPQSDVDTTGWLWMGFGRENYYDFSTEGNDAVSALLLGQAGGSALLVTKNFLPSYTDTMAYANGLPFGPRSTFETRAKAGAHAAQYAALLSGGAVYADGRADGAGTTIEIVHVCRGQAEQQLVTIVATWPVRTAQDFNTYTNQRPRYHYVRRARWRGDCDDGRSASYEVGPIRVLTPRGRPDDEWNLDSSPWKWVLAQWDLIEPGVRLSPTGAGRN